MKFMGKMVLVVALVGVVIVLHPSYRATWYGGIRDLVTATHVLAKAKDLPERLPSKISLFTSYCALTFQKSVESSSPDTKVQTTLADFKVTAFNYKTLQWLFREIFINNVYAFASDAKNPVILDCGSNIGMSILYFKRIHPSAIIYGFEPDKRTFEVLKSNIEGNALENVHLFNNAVYKEDTTLTFYHSETDPSNLAKSLSKASGLKDEQLVQAVRLSAFIDRDIDFLKLDVEGAECDVIQEVADAGKLGKIKHMAIEYHHHLNKAEDKLAGLLTNLEKNGFGYFFYGSDFDVMPHPAGTGQNFMIYVYHKG